jgi:hypothetical protein
MADEHRTWKRPDEGFWWAHHEAWKRSDLNQRQYCEAEGSRARLSASGVHSYMIVQKLQRQPVWPVRTLGSYRRKLVTA